MESKLLKTGKKLLLEFFMIVFLIGFFSNSFASYTLPRATSVRVFAGSYEKSFPIEGSVQHQQSFHIRLRSGVIVEEYFTNPGRRVQKGDPLFRIDNKFGVYESDHQIIDLEARLERELIQLERLSLESTIVDQKQIALLEQEILREEEELLKRSALYESGAISLQERQGQQQKIEDLKSTVALESLKLGHKEKEKILRVKETEININQLERQIKEMRNQEPLHAKLSEDGIYYAEVDGIISQTNRVNQVISPDEVIMSIDIIGEQVTDFKYVGYMSEKYGTQLNLGNTLRIGFRNNNDSIVLKIEEMYFVEDKNAYLVEGELMSEVPSKIIMGRNYAGEVKRTEKGQNVIPKSAILAADFNEGETGRVFVVETTEGILGKQSIAREVPVVIVGVGDQHLDIEGLESYENPRVITNLSYQIRDGVKVSHGS